MTTSFSCGGLAAIGALIVLTMCPVNAEAAPRLVGIAFTSSSVTSMGSRAQLPAGTTIYPSGVRITGTTGCPTNRYMTDGMIVAVIDYAGPPTAASLQVTRQPASGGRFEDAPYYIDLNAGRTLQTLGPIFANGAYSLKLLSGMQTAKSVGSSGGFILARSCPQPH